MVWQNGMHRALAENLFVRVGAAGQGFARLLAVTLCVAGGLSACSTFHSVFGGGHSAPKQTADADTDDSAEPKFAKPQITGKGSPDLASVPDTTPAQPSTKQEREKIIEGLLADRDRAHYTTQESRVEPIDVRPLTQAQAEPDTTPATPPQASGAPVAAVTKLQTPPAQAPTNIDELAARADIPPPPPPPDDTGRPRLPSARTASADVGPEAPQGATKGGASTPNGPRAYSGLGVRSDGFRTLESFERGGGPSIRVATLDFGINGRELTPADKRTIGDAAQMAKGGTGTFRVIGRSKDASEVSQARATATARELQRQGIAQDRIFVGSDAGNEGTVDVYLDK